MRQQMILHCGGKAATLDELRAVPLPEETSSYKPVSHYDLVLNIGQVAENLLSDYTFDKGRYALSQNGGRMFGIHIYTDQTEVSDLGLAIGFRNSYHKSLSGGIPVGGMVLVL